MVVRCVDKHVRHVGGSIGCWAALSRLIVNQLPELHHQGTFLRYSRESLIHKLAFLSLGCRCLGRCVTFLSRPRAVRTPSSCLIALR